MAEPENMTIALLRELRAELDRQDKARAALERRFDNLRQAVTGESVLGRYAAAEVEERLTEVERRLQQLESSRH
jgi:polyhydroxyalkanoate synthesis regulator phasin